MADDLSTTTDFVCFVISGNSQLRIAATPREGLPGERPAGTVGERGRAARLHASVLPLRYYSIIRQMTKY